MKIIKMLRMLVPFRRVHKLGCGEEEICTLLSGGWKPLKRYVTADNGYVYLLVYKRKHWSKD